jgi:hypothetical protein
MASGKWRDICKFLAGATFVGAFSNAYLAAYGVEIPTPLGFDLPPVALGVRAVVGAVLFGVFLYLGYFAKSNPTANV